MAALTTVIVAGFVIAGLIICSSLKIKDLLDTCAHLESEVNRLREQRNFWRQRHNDICRGVIERCRYALIGKTPNEEQAKDRVDVD